MDDKELLQLLEQDPENGIRQLTRQYAGLTYAIVSGRAGSIASEEDIEECVSDIFFEVFQKRSSIDLEKGSLRAFLSVVSRQRAINLYRKKAREAQHITFSEPPEATVIHDFEDDFIHAEDRRTLIETIRSLGEPDSQIIVRKYYFGQKSKEIATDLGMTPGAVDTRLSRAIGKLRSMLGGKYDG